MDLRTEESLRAEISAIENIRYSERSAEDKTRLNALEAELQCRRHAEAQSGKYSFLYFPK